MWQPSLRGNEARMALARDEANGHTLGRILRPLRCFRFGVYGTTRMHRALFGVLCVWSHTRR